uniref:Uncharacterized protein n=1 Tax=Aegilops tauschii subsp. strangulata TaxID=200361 RepID=A0A453PI74_AEGTS
MEAHRLLIMFLDWPLRRRPKQTSAGVCSIELAMGSGGGVQELCGLMALGAGVLI